MRIIFFILLALFCLPFLLKSQITRQEVDEKDKNKKIIYKVEGSSDLDILNQLDPDVEIGQEIQIAWEKPQQRPVPTAPVKTPVPQTIKTPKVPRPTPKPAPNLTVTPTPSTQKRESSSPQAEKQKVVAMSSKKRHKKKAFKVFGKSPKNQKRKKQNLKKCYTF